MASTAPRPGGLPHSRSGPPCRICEGGCGGGFQHLAVAGSRRPRRHRQPLGAGTTGSWRLPAGYCGSTLWERLGLEVIAVGGKVEILLACLGDSRVGEDGLMLRRLDAHRLIGPSDGQHFNIQAQGLARDSVTHPRKGLLNPGTWGVTALNRASAAATNGMRWGQK